MPIAAKTICIGICGGSGSGKSWLADYIKRNLGERAEVVCQDWYYHDNSALSVEESRKLNFDHPSAIEIELLCRQLERLLAGTAIEAPRYDYARHARLPETRTIEPAPVIILDGLLILAEERLRRILDLSVYIEVPADVRLLRRLRRDSKDRRVDLEETLRLYEHCVRPMHERFIAPSAEHATWAWRQLEDKNFPQELLRVLQARLEPVLV